jgi:hypothetical protein
MSTIELLADRCELTAFELARHDPTPLLGGRLTAACIG